MPVASLLRVPAALAAAFLLLVLGLSAGCSKKVILTPVEDEPGPRVQDETPARALPTAEEFATNQRRAPAEEPAPAREAKAVVREIATRAEAPRPYQEEGQAGRYGDEDQGRILASGQAYDREALTAAHRILPMGTRLEVVNLENGRTVTVTVNDRGPFKDADKRIVDLSHAAATGLNMVGDHPARVRIRADIAGAAGGDIPGVFYVQVGSYTIRENAEKVLSGLREAGYPQSRIVESSSGGKAFHRVQAGAFQGLAAAREAQGKLRLAYPGSLILTD